MIVEFHVGPFKKLHETFQEQRLWSKSYQQKLISRFIKTSVVNIPGISKDRFYRQQLLCCIEVKKTWLGIKCLKLFLTLKRNKIVEHLLFVFDGREGVVLLCLTLIWDLTQSVQFSFKLRGKRLLNLLNLLATIIEDEEEKKFVNYCLSTKHSHFSCNVSSFWWKLTDKVKTENLDYYYLSMTLEKSK